MTKISPLITILIKLLKCITPNINTYIVDARTEQDKESALLLSVAMLAELNTVSVPALAWPHPLQYQPKGWCVNHNQILICLKLAT